MQHLEVSLQQYGFSSKEAKVYLAALELGAAPASTIARYAKEKRATVYSILKELEKKGIVSHIQRNDIAYFSVISPTRLGQILEEKYKKFSTAVPELLAVADKIGSKPKVQYFEGIEGVKQMYDMTLSHENQQMYAFINPSKADSKLQHYLNEVYLPQRLKKGLTVDVLLSAKENHKKAYKPLSIKRYRSITSIKICPIGLNSFANEINIFDEDKVSIFNFSSDEMSGIIVQSKSYYQTMKSLFSFMWLQSTDV